MERPLSTVRSLVKKAAWECGVDIRRRDWRDLGARRVQFLARHGVTTVFDVGANAGQWARALRSAGFRGTIVSFEPLSSAFRSLDRASRRDVRWSAVNAALGAASERRFISVSSNSWSSSLLPMEEAHLIAAPDSEYVSQEEVTVITLDEVCSGRLGVDERTYLKLDVQGSEMDVLRGAELTLPQIEVIETELSLCELYSGQVLCDDMIEFMAGLGFRIVGLAEGFTDRRTGRLLQFDAVFERFDDAGTRRSL